MNNWTVGKRVTFGFATILLLVAGLAIASFVFLRQAKTAAHFNATHALPGLECRGDDR